MSAAHAFWPFPIRALDEACLRHLHEIREQPFILVQVSTGDVEKFVAFYTHSDSHNFLKELEVLNQPGQSVLLSGVALAVRHEIYDSGDAFFRWMLHGSGSAREWIFLGLPDTANPPPYKGYPVIGVRQGGPSQDAPDDRLQVLLRLLDAWSLDQSEDPCKLSVLESLALGLSRALGSRGRFVEALPIIEVALGRRPQSIHLRAAKHALSLAAEGKIVPPRLAKFIGEDNGYLKKFVCPEPFKRFDIGPTGDVLVCCGHWLPTPIGNFMRSKTDEVLNSPTAQAIRKSVTDGTYKYCNHLDCTALIQEYLPSREDVNDFVVREAISKDEFKVDRIDRILFALDRTCNLSCPSCRREKIVERESESEEKAQAVAEKLLPLLPNLQLLDINPAGEFLASKPSRRLLELIGKAEYPYLSIHIISNGTLFSEEEWEKFSGIHDKVGVVRISTDAARKDTFELLRRGGNWEKFIANLRFLSRLKREKKIDHLNLSFTYQLRNFREMAEFVEFGLDLDCSFIIFERLQNMGAFTDEEYRAKAVHLPEHPLHKEFLEIVRHPTFRNARVWHDFDFEGVERLSQSAARRRAVSSGGTTKSKQHLAEGRKHEAQGERVRALASYRCAAEADPNWAEPYLAIGNIQSVLGGIGEAVSCLKKVLNLTPDMPDTHFRLAALFSARDRFSAAHESCACGVDLTQHLGVRHADEWREIYFATFREMTELGLMRLDAPGPASAVWEHGKALADQGRYDDAVEHYRRTAQFWKPVMIERV